MTGVDICSQNTISAEDIEEDHELFDETQATNLNNEIQRNLMVSKTDAYFDFSSDDENDQRHGFFEDNLGGVKRNRRPKYPLSK